MDDEHDPRPPGLADYLRWYWPFLFPLWVAAGVVGAILALLAGYRLD